jgi:hypothetical protein
MQRESVNGLFVPTDGSAAAERYSGHFLKVSYVQLIQGRSVYSKDRVDVEADGSFRFFIPLKELLADEMVQIELYAPDGELMGKKSYSYGSLHAAFIDESAPDVTSAMEIAIDPKVIDFQTSEAEALTHRRVRGKLLDISGERSAAGLQVLLMVSNDPDAAYDSASYQPLLAAVTDKEGYFLGKVENLSWQQAYGVVAGLESQPIPIALDSEKKLPHEIILVSDLTGLPEKLAELEPYPSLPDGDTLAGSGSYSQDLGGKCVDFTVPNRTLEEFSYYHTVRTTEPEIRGLTVTSSETRKLRDELLTISDGAFTLLGRVSSSFSSLSVMDYSIEEEEPAEQAEPAAALRMVSTAGTTAAAASNYSVATPVYKLKLAAGPKMLAFKSSDLIQNIGFDFSNLLKMLAEQERRRKKLEALHRKVAAAYCGKHGAEVAQEYCDSLEAEDSLNRNTVRALLGHMRDYAAFVKSNAKLAKQFETFAAELDTLVSAPYADAEAIALTEKKGEKLIAAVDKGTGESQDQEELLGYLRRIVTELAHAREGSANNYEPCPPAEQKETMGIRCLMQEFDKTKEVLRNKAIFTLGEILMIRANYDTFLNSIVAFMALLEEFHAFYASGGKTAFALSLEDDYFVEHYASIKHTLQNLKQQIYRAISRIEAIERAYITNHPGRRELTVETSIDWDDTPTIYENTTIAHGHILHFKQKWKADGYSLGDLLYSLPLAPCQEKQIAILDWDREERAARSEAQTVTEALQANLSRDRDISEIINSSLTENIYASSTNRTGSTSAGIGGGIGGFFGGIAGGIFGGVSHSGASSKSTSHQSSARNLSSGALNRLQDNLAQSASAVRGQRSTVVQTVGQNETVSAQTEVIKNNNHCHAMTVEYFEVLKHYAIEQELVDVQECLFVPLPMGHFDHQKILRWKNTLRRAVYGTTLRRGFDAIERIENHYANSDFPSGAYADETIRDFTGHFSLSFELKRPYIKDIEEATTTEYIDLADFFPWHIGHLVIPYREVPLTEAEKDALFEADYAPDIVRSFIDTLEIAAITEDGSEIPLDLDYTLLSTYRRGAPLQINIASKTVPGITRRKIAHLRFRAKTAVKASSKILLRSAYLHYRTDHMSAYILNNSRINNDIITTREIQWSDFSIRTVTDAALLYTPMSDREERDPRREDREAAQQLVQFLNEHLEMSHKAIWTGMDSARLFGLLDGYVAPNTNGKSVASVVENRVIGVVGNNLVLKVIPGERLDPVFKSIDDLMEYYRPTTKPDPFRISVPTKGVYAESVMGRCNSCEEIDDSRHWRFEDAPCGTTPTAISPLSTESRRSDTGNLQVKDLPTNIVAMQTAPAAPDPTGLTAAYNLLGKSDIFKDMTGLAGTQANALQALQTTSKSVTDLAGMASDIVKQQAMKKDIDKTLKTIKKAEDGKQISGDQANKLSYSALSSMVGEPTKSEKLTQESDVQNAIKKAADAKKDITINRGSESVAIATPKTGGSTESSYDYTVPGLVPTVAQPSSMTCWATVATMMLSWKNNQSFTIQEAMDRAGSTYRTMFDNNQGLPAAEHEAFAAACGMKGEPPMSYTPNGIRSLLENYGPLIAVADEAPGDKWAIHARVIRGIYGDGSVDNTFLRINDPAGGKQYSESFRTFANKFEEVADSPRLQIMHY